ncbi:MAG: PEP/pyruvate-binding domain-containing protein [Deltaproteobacteria bacterium]
MASDDTLPTTTGTAGGGAPWDQFFHDMMPNRVREVLLVSSPYDAFILEEDGRLTDRIFTEYSELNLSNAPRITHVSSGARAMEILGERRFDLVMTMVRIADTDASALGREVKQKHPAMPVVLLVRTEADLGQFVSGLDASAVDHVFCWTGDARIMLAIIKLVEDRLNIAHDMLAGVRAVIVVEDSVRRYSSFLSMLYAELMKQSESLVAEGLNDLHRLVRMRARPKVLLARSYEEAMALFETYQEAIIAVISDVRFPRRGEEDAQAGFDLVREMRARAPDLAVMMQSAEGANAKRAESVGVAYADKNSPHLLKEIRDFVKEALGFGDFVFRLPNRTELGRARHAYELEQMLVTVPAESIAYHASRDHFSHWLTARCMFTIAKRLRSRKADEFGGPEAIRSFLVEALAEERMRQQEGAISDYSASKRQSAAAQFIRLGKGSIGGKARGLAFVSTLIARYGLAERFPGLSIRIPYSVVVPTDEFDRFMEGAKILEGGWGTLTEAEVLKRFMTARLSDDLRHKLRRTVAGLSGPLAVRSSSLLEDSQLQPFAGIYATHMIPNNHPDPDERFGQLCRAIKAVWASTYSDDARSYISRTQFSVEEEKMAVLIEEVVGQPHGDRFYPHIAGVAVSYNYYPVGHQRAEDRLAVVALGLGQTIVQGGAALQFSPSDPSILPQFGSSDDYLRYTQKRFCGLDLTTTTPDLQAGGSAKEYELRDAETDGTLGLVGSVYAPDDDIIRDNLAIPGPRVVTFHNVLKWNAIPLAPALAELLRLFREGFGCPVEIEFAVDAGDYGLPTPAGRARREPCLNVLQVRPQATQLLDGAVETEGFAPGQILCTTDRSLGHGVIDGVRDIVVVKRNNLQPHETPAVAEQVGVLNAKLSAEKTPYLLIGPGRWGTSDPRLGIPVRWAQIAGAKVIVETVFQDREVEPSQAAHFFHNVTSFRIGYLTISNVDRRDGAHSRMLDEDWLNAQPEVTDTGEVRHIRLAKPLRILLDGRQSTATVLKPE